MWTYIKLRYKLFFVLLLFWFLVQYNLRIETIILGILVSFFVTVMSYDVLYDEHGYRYHGIRLRTMFRYVISLFVEIYKAGFTYIFHLISGKYEPVVFTVVLKLKDDVMLGIIANSITLTPGTISIKVDTKHHMITVMTIAKKGTPLEDLERSIHEKFEDLLIKEEGHQ